MKTFLLTLALIVPAWAVAHPVPCPRCGLKIVQSTEEQDNEVVLRYGKKRIEYRSVDCALADAMRYDGDLFVYAPSETKGRPVVLRRTGGEWSAVRVQGETLVPEPEAVFLMAYRDHKDCALLSRAFHTRAAFDAYAPKPKGAKALSLAELLKEVV